MSETEPFHWIMLPGMREPDEDDRLLWEYGFRPSLSKDGDGWVVYCWVYEPWKPGNSGPVRAYTKEQALDAVIEMGVA